LKVFSKTEKYLEKVKKHLAIIIDDLHFPPASQEGLKAHQKEA